MSVNDPNYPHTTEVRETYGTAPETTVIRTVVRESRTGWWLAAFVAVVAILAVVFMVTRSPTRDDNQVQTAIEQARTQATLDAQNNMAAQSAAAQSAAAQQSLAQSASVAQQTADAQARADLATRQASLAAQQASQRQAEQALDRAARSTPTPTPSDSAASGTP